MEGINPWVAVLSSPRSSIRAIIGDSSNVRFWIFATVYGIASCFYTANFYSWGLTSSLFTILIPLLILSPIYGSILLQMDAWVLQLTMRLFGGEKIPFHHVRGVVSWAKAPYFLSLAMWAIFALSKPEVLFIHYASNDLAVTIVFATLLINLWSFIILSQMVREIQGISLLKSISAVLTSYFISFIFYVLALFIVRYLYIAFV